MKGIKPIFSLDDTAWFMHDFCPVKGKVIEISIVTNKFKTEISYTLSYGRHFTEKSQSELYLTKESLIKNYKQTIKQ